MENQAYHKWRDAEKIQARLMVLLREDKPTYMEFDTIMFEFRQACEHTVFLDIEYASKARAGERLWEAHTLINARYRKLLQKFDKKEAQHLKVERRKLEKHYADFLKTSSHFFTGYVQRLASHYGGLPDMYRVANALHLSTLSVTQPIEASPNVKKLVLLTTHATLWRLGDIARYRNKLRRKDQSWDRALAYYQLANDLYPASGYGHNQMAVIALSEDNHLNAVYHLYRAMTALEPHPLANKNLATEFKKIVAAWERRRQLPKQDSLTSLIWWFCLLQAKFYDGKPFSSHGELENEVLSRMALLLKEKSFPEMLDKFVLTSIAAQHHAAAKVQEPDAPESATTYYFFCLEFNVRMMFAFLQILLPELEDHSSGEELPNGKAKERETITAIARRVLPAIRQYGVWLAKTAHILLAPVGPESLQIHKKELWDMYAIVLTRLNQTYPAPNMSRVDYLLNEDALTVGFPPLQDLALPKECNLHVNPEGVSKPHVTDQERQLPNIEMESRILDILRCAIKLHINGTIPVSISHHEGQAVFTYNQDGLPHVTPAESAKEEIAPLVATPAQLTTSGKQESVRNVSPNLSSTNYTLQEAPNPSFEVQPEGSITHSEAHGSMDDNMHRMVDDLLAPSTKPISSAPDETSYGMHSRTANEVFAPLGSHGMERVHSTPKMLPSLPGLYNSAFTPKPNELQPSSPNRPTTARQLSPLSLATSQERRAAALAFDEQIGFRPGTWSRKSARRVSDEDMPVTKALQQSLAQQSTQSSDFSNPSSLYFNNTPQHRVGGFNGMTSHMTNGTTNGNSTYYPGATDFDRVTMLQSSVWNGSQPAYNAGGYAQTPPGGQGG